MLYGLGTYGVWLCLLNQYQLTYWRLSIRDRLDMSPNSIVQPGYRCRTTHLIAWK